MRREIHKGSSPAALDRSTLGAAERWLSGKRVGVARRAGLPLSAIDGESRCSTPLSSPPGAQIPMVGSGAKNPDPLRSGSSLTHIQLRGVNEGLDVSCDAVHPSGIRSKRSRKMFTCVAR